MNREISDWIVQLEHWRAERATNLPTYAHYRLEESIEHAWVWPLVTLDVWNNLQREGGMYP